MSMLWSRRGTGEVPEGRGRKEKAVRSASEEKREVFFYCAAEAVREKKQGESVRCPNCGKRFRRRNPRRVYCCEACRRTAQNVRRKDERAEARELREAEQGPWLDPWARCDLDDWSADQIWANALLDPAPDMSDRERARLGR